MNDYHRLVPTSSSPPTATRPALPLDEALAAALAEVPVAPQNAAEDEWFAYSVQVQRHLHDYGLVGLEWPRRYGGRGLDPVQAGRVLRVLGAAGIPELANFVGIDVLAPVLIEHVEPERLERWLPAMAAADEIWCQLFSEPEAGSDLASLRATARPTPEGWVVNGQKVWSTWAHHARWGVLLARTGSAESRHRGITAFVIDMRTPGITTRPLRTMTGTAHFSEVFLDEVLVPADSVIGEVDRGWSITMSILEHERGTYPGSRAAVLRRAFGRIVASVPTPAPDAVRIRLARVAARLEALDAVVDTVLRRVAAGQPLGADAAIAKVLLSRTEQLLYDTAYDVWGDAGVVWAGELVPHDVQDYLYSIAATIYGGARNIQLNIIGERGLGLPR
jgi:alkylation response protein AidB-like acyl-CoA dehydrogenase